VHTMLAPLLAAIVHGGATPVLWIIGIILIVSTDDLRAQRDDLGSTEGSGPLRSRGLTRMRHIRP
jgi:hypothetical protein